MASKIEQMVDVLLGLNLGKTRGQHEPWWQVGETHGEALDELVRCLKGKDRSVRSLVRLD